MVYHPYIFHYTKTQLNIIIITFLIQEKKHSVKFLLRFIRV